MSHKYRIFYAAGPGDVIGTYHFWKAGKSDPSHLGYTDSEQFYDVVTEYNAQALVIASCSRIDAIQDGPFEIRHIPKKKRTGKLYHLEQVLYGIKMCREAIRFKADAALIEEGTAHWFVWKILRLFGIKIIPAFKCTLWPCTKPLSNRQKILNFINRSLFRNYSSALITMSKAIEDQINMITKSSHPPFVPFLPVYRKEIFSDIKMPEYQKRPFNVLFIGRMEVNKGVFDIIAIAKEFRHRGLLDIHFHFCGSGTLDNELLKAIEAENLGTTCQFYGYCNQDQLKPVLSKSHVVLVPTRSDFVEGFNMVVAEAVLAKRPVVSSPACPALAVVRPAAMEAIPDKYESYRDAILSLYHDPILYAQKVAACSTVSEQFYDMHNSWKSAIDNALNIARNEHN